MKALMGQIALEIKLFLRRKDELFWNLAFPLFFMVLYGLIYGDTIWGEIKAIDYMFPGIIVMALMVNGIMVAATIFVEERGKGIYRRLSLTPLKRHTIIGAQIIQRYMVTLIQTILLLAIGIFGFKVNITGNYFYFWLLLTFGSLCFLSIGFALATLIRSTRSATPICLIVFFMMLFLGGIFFPLDVMPDFMSVIAKFLPSTHLNDAIRLVVIEGAGLGTVWLDLLIVGAWFLVSLVVSIKFFRWE
jgi:ABC-2 type transport system permease protein